MPPAAASGNSGRNIVLVVVGAVGALVLLGILAAIAIPVFLNERSKAEASHTTISVPAQVLGMPQLTDRVTAAQIERLRTMPGAGLQFAGAYGDGRITVVVGAAKSALGFDGQRGYFAGASRSASQQGITLSKIKPGKLGGEMRCGAHRTLPMTICAFADGGSYGVVVVTGPATDPESTARSAREAFVHRA
jgi:hypothetical protein